MQSSLTRLQMMVISDLDDIFVPFPDDLIVNLSESRSMVESFLDGLSSMFQGNMNEESAFGSALKAAFMVIVCFFFNQWHLQFFLFISFQRTAKKQYCH